jgi:hypothetical protein
MKATAGVVLVSHAHNLPPGHPIHLHGTIFYRFTATLVDVRTAGRWPVPAVFWP